MARLLVDSSEKVPINKVEVTVEGTLSSTPGGQGMFNMSLEHQTLRMVCLPEKRTILPEGQTQYYISFILSPTAPPSFSGKVLKSLYVLKVKIDIPWWPDATRGYMINVEPPPALTGPSAPVVVVSHRDGPRGKEPYLECSLSSPVLQPGGRLQGAVALSNTASNRFRGISLCLVAREACRHHGVSFSASARVHAWRIPVDNPTEDQPIPFALRLPVDLSPSIQTESLKLSWTLEVKAMVSWGSDLVLTVPVEATTRPATETESDPPVAALPAVGSPRMNVVWKEVAREAGLVLAGECMEGEVSGARVEVRREQRGRVGLFLVGVLRYQSLNLALAVRPARGLRRHLGGGLSFGDKRLDRENYILGRHPHQVEHLGAHLTTALRPFRTVNMGDDQLMVQRRGGGQKRSALARFTAELVRLARALDGARKEIPPPREMVRGVAAWQGLARQLQGSLEQATMSVAGIYRGHEVSVDTIWSESGRALHTAVELQPRSPLLGDLELDLEFGVEEGATPGQTVVDQHQLAALPNSARAMIPDLRRRGASRLQIRPGAICSHLPAPLLDPTPALEMLADLEMLARTLHPDLGPYR